MFKYSLSLVFICLLGACPQTGLAQTDCVVFENAVKILPSDIEAWQNWVKCEGEQQDAVSERTEQKTKPSPKAKEQDKYARQIEILQKAALANPKNVSILLFWANTLQGFAAGKDLSFLDKWRWYFQASELLNKALQLEGENPKLWQAQADNYKKLAELADFPEQADFLRKQAKFYSLKASNLERLAKQLPPIPQFCLAETQFANAHSENAQAWGSLATCLQAEAKENQELSINTDILFRVSASYQQLIKLQPDNFIGLFTWGNSLFKLANRLDYSTTQGRETFQKILTEFEAGLKITNAAVFKNWAVATKNLQEVRKTGSSSKAWLALAKQLEIVIVDVEKSTAWDEYKKLQIIQPIWKQVRAAYTQATQLSPNHLEAWQGRATAAMGEYQSFASFGEPSMVPVYLLREAANSYAQVAKINPAQQDAEIKRILALLELASRLEDPYQKFILLQAIVDECEAAPKNQPAYNFIYLAGSEALMTMAGLVFQPELQQEYVNASYEFYTMAEQIGKPPLSFVAKLKALRAALEEQNLIVNNPSGQVAAFPLSGNATESPAEIRLENATAQQLSADQPEDQQPEDQNPGQKPDQEANQASQEKAELPLAEIIKRLKLNPNSQAHWDLWQKKALEQIKYSETLEGQTKGGAPAALEALFAPMQGEINLQHNPQTWGLWQKTVDALQHEFKEDSEYLIRAQAVILSRAYAEKQPENAGVWINLAGDLLKQAKLAVDEKEKQDLLNESAIAVERGLGIAPSAEAWELWRTIYSDYSPVITSAKIRKQAQIQALNRFAHRSRTIRNSTLALENWGVALVQLAEISRRQKEKDVFVKLALTVSAALSKEAPQDFGSTLRWLNTLQKTLALSDSPFVRLEILEQLSGLASQLADLIPDNSEYRLKAANALQQWGLALNSEPSKQHSTMSKANEYYAKAFELDPYSPEVLENWGQALLQYSNTSLNKEDKTMQRHFRAMAADKFAQAVDVSTSYDLSRCFAQWGSALMAQSELAESQVNRVNLQKDAYMKFQISQDMSNYHQPDLRFWLNWSDTLLELAIAAQDDESKNEFFNQACIQLEQAIWHYEAAQKTNNYSKQQLFEAWANILSPNSNYPITALERQTLRDKAGKRYKVRTLINKKVASDLQFFFSRHLSL